MSPDIAERILSDMQDDDILAGRYCSAGQATAVNIMLGKALPGAVMRDEVRLGIFSALIGREVKSTWALGKRVAHQLIEWAYGERANLDADPPVKLEMQLLLSQLYFNEVSGQRWTSGVKALPAI